MNWDDVDEILYDGTEEEIRAARCPDCGGKLEFEFGDPPGGSMTIRCRPCGVITKACGVSSTPNCVEIFGKKGTIE